jgi:O-succinylbenzoic acid--CoA ligase
VNRHLDVSHNSRWGLAVPAPQVGGLGVAAGVYHGGAKLSIFEAKWTAAAFRDWLERESVTQTSLVPTQVHDLKHGNSTAPPALRAIVVGGGRLETVAGRRARDLGWPVLASYGMTEAGSQIATGTLDELSKPYLPAPIPLLPIWNARTSQDSRLEISGPALFSGYVIDGKYRPRESAWHLTADRTELHEGFLTPLGRADTVVKILGELVDPAEVERELISISGATAAVVAIPDARAGHSLIPVFENSISRETADNAISAYNSQVPGFRRLGAAVYLADIPRSPLGKIRRGELLELLRAK